MESREEIRLLKEEIKKLKEHTRSNILNTSFIYLVIYICAIAFFWYMYCEQEFGLAGAICNTLAFVFLIFINILNMISSNKELRENKENKDE